MTTLDVIKPARKGRLHNGSRLSGLFTGKTHEIHNFILSELKHANNAQICNCCMLNQTLVMTSERVDIKPMGFTN